MSEFKSPSYDDISNKLIILQMSNLNLNEKIKLLRNNIKKLQDKQSHEICKYFIECKSIVETTGKFYFEDVRDCYEALNKYFGYSNLVENANDYKDCYKEIFGHEYDYDYDYEYEYEYDNIYISDEELEGEKI
jgi:hypothetical protein